MKTKITITALTVILLLSACDIISPNRFYSAVDAYNEVEQPGDSNYWRRLYYTGVDLGDGDYDDMHCLIINGTLYFLGLSNSPDDKHLPVLFARIDLETLASSLLTGLDIDTGDYSYDDCYRAGDDLFTCYIVTGDNDSVTGCQLFRYRTDTETWDETDFSISFDSLEVITCRDRYFFLVRDSSDNTYRLYEYADRTVTLRHTSPDATGRGVYNDTDLVFLCADYPDTVERYNFNTDSVDTVSLTYDLVDTSGFHSELFLTEANRLLVLHHDQSSNDTASLLFDPPVLDYVDLDGDRVWNRKVYDSSVTGIGSSLSAELYDGDIYLGTGFSGYVDDVTGVYTALVNPDIHIFKIAGDSLEIEDLGLIPQGPGETFLQEIREVDGILYLQTSTGIINHPRSYYYLPGTSGTGSWQEVADSYNLLGVTWCGGFGPEDGYNGKYYEPAIIPGFQVIPYCLLKYTPPVM